MLENMAKAEFGQPDPLPVPTVRADVNLDGSKKKARRTWLDSDERAPGPGEPVEEHETCYQWVSLDLKEASLVSRFVTRTSH